MGLKFVRRFFCKKHTTPRNGKTEVTMMLINFFKNFMQVKIRVNVIQLDNKMDNIVNLYK